MRKVYFNAFRPIKNSPLEGLPPASLLRAHRLCQTDWLLRVYGFSTQEIELALGKGGNLPPRKDTKLVIAEKQPWLFPVDVNQASYDELLRVPGIRPVSARRITETRQEHSTFSIEQLRKMQVDVRRALPFIWSRACSAGRKKNNCPFCHGSMRHPSQYLR
ncbi:helix-hairpin-helix domain-containing protein [Chloroflexota bacterium]